MRRLQMGMWHAFSESMWKTYGMGELNGLEICAYESEESLGALRAFCDRERIAFGIHGPILGHDGYKLPRLSDPDPEERDRALQRIKREAELASRYGADYILFHYPYYPVFPSTIRKLYPQMPRPDMRYDDGRMPEVLFRDVSERLFHELAQLQHRLGQRIVLEHDYFGAYEDIFVEMFRAYPEIGLVVDTARLDVNRRAFDGFDPYAWLDKLAPSVYLVHYGHVRYDGDSFTHHLPVQGAHDGDESYGDALEYLRFLARRNDAFHITFEHDPERVSREELRAIYRRTADLCGIDASR